MAFHPGNTASLWLHELAPIYSGDSITLANATVTVSMANRKGEVVIEAAEATLIEAEESFRLVCTLPDTPGWYEAIFEIEAGEAMLTLTAPIVVEAITGAGS
jgi:hypothetical protein